MNGFPCVKSPDIFFEDISGDRAGGLLQAVVAQWISGSGQNRISGGQGKTALQGGEHSQQDI